MTKPSDERHEHDDGLVHSHNWASSTAPGGRPEALPLDSVTRSVRSHDGGRAPRPAFLK